ncbi:MAG: hypothetical protein NXI10_04040 [bacterium]|nr:hypothetical protein [bacterium]
MKSAACFILLLLTCCVSAQNPINKSYSNGGTREGEHKIKYADGTLQEEYTIKGGNLHGARRWYNKDGSLRFEENFKEGHYDGWCTYFNAKGDTINADYYSMDTLLLVKMYEYHKNGVLSDYYWTQYEQDSTLDVNPFHGFKIFGKRFLTNRRVDKYTNHHGEHTIYYNDGSLQGFTQFRNNEFHGEHSLYHQNGAMATKAQCKNGNFVGPYYEYYDNGTLKISATYNLDGKLTGLYEEFNLDGTLKKRKEH